MVSLSAPDPPRSTAASPLHISISTLHLLTVRTLLAIVFFGFLCGPARAQTQNVPDCRPVAYLPPMATFGGPATAPRGGTELAAGFGDYDEILRGTCIHVGALDWLVRWRRGISDHIDFGFDLLTNSQADKTLGGTAKLAVRYQVTQGFRLEGGVGVADGGDGRDVNGDFAAVIGTHNADRIWNYYMSIRLGAARGCISCGPNETNHAPGGLVPLGAIGITARISENTKFVMEAGLGGIFARQYSAPAGYVHLSFGLQFNVGKDRK